MMKNKIFTQLIATFGVMLLTIQTGSIDGWTSPNMSRLTEGNSTITLTLKQASWLATCLTIGRFASIIFVPIFIELAGSKKSILFTFIPVGVSWILTMSATSALYLYIARFLSGITYGLAYSCFPIYLGEISMPTYRGTFISISTIGWPLGTLISTASETYLPQVASCSVYLVPCVFGIFLFAWLPESPYHLIKKKKSNEARESLDWYRGHNETDVEMKEIIEYVESANQISFKARMRQLRTPGVRKAVALVTLIFILPHLCGVFNVIFYMQIILTNGKSYLIDPSQTVVYTNVILLISTIVAVNLVDKLGRRVLLMISNSIMAMALLSLGLHYYLLNSLCINPISIEELPIASIAILVVTFSAGFSPVLNTILGEMFPNSIKSTAAMIATFGSSFVSFIATLSYQFFIDTIGETYLFTTYAVLMTMSIPIFLFFLPETKGKSLQEIQNELNEKNDTKV